MIRFPFIVLHVEFISVKKMDSLTFRVLKVLAFLVCRLVFEINLIKVVNKGGAFVCVFLPFP